MLFLKIFSLFLAKLSIKKLQLEPSATSLKFTSYLNANLYLIGIDDVVFETSLENLRSKQKVSCHS